MSDEKARTLSWNVNFSAVAPPPLVRLRLLQCCPASTCVTPPPVIRLRPQPSDSDNPGDSGVLGEDTQRVSTPGITRPRPGATQGQRLEVLLICLVFPRKRKYCSFKYCALHRIFCHKLLNIYIFFSIFRHTYTFICTRR